MIPLRLLSTPEPFPYQALADDHQQIRLLKIQPVGLSRAIVCELETFDIAQAPRYAAISYTWGNPRRPRRIVINKRRVDVRRNCYYALWQARRHNLYEYIWIDALCINQTDLHEKSNQVGMMGEIYAQADTVLLSLGRHENDSEVLLIMLRNFHETTNRINASAFNSFAEAHGPTGTTRFYSALRAFINREYWQRVWVVQELMVARAIYVLCGADLVDWLELVGLRNFITTHGAYGFRQSRLGSALGNWDPEIEQAPMWRIADTLRLPQLSLEYIILYFKSWYCSNPLDKIYGFLHVIEWAKGSSVGIDKLRPDYTKSTYDLMSECVDRILWRVAGSEREPWTMITLLMESLGFENMHQRLSELITERQNLNDAHTPSTKSLGFGANLDSTSSPRSTFKFRSASRLGKYGDDAFTAALSVVQRQQSRHRLEEERLAVPLLYPNSEVAALPLAHATGRVVAGFICPDAEVGDILLEPPDWTRAVLGYHLRLVAREVSALDIYEIVGYAAFSRDYDFWSSSRTSHEINEKVEPLAIPDYDFEGDFCKEDLLACIALCSGSQALPLLPTSHSPLKDILDTRVAATRFSSFVIRRKRVGEAREDVLSKRRASWPAVALQTRATAEMRLSNYLRRAETLSV